MSSLSVLCITNDPGPQVAAILAPLRAVAYEIVIAADARVGAEDLGHYAGACDRLLRYEFALPVERPYAWAHAQCTGDWILRIDGDELVGPELVTALPALLARTDRLQYWIPRRWSYPDAGHWIDERPWAPDHQLRLVRNDPATMAFDGIMHSAARPVTPSQVIEAPMYHLDLLCKSVEQRRRKAEVYEDLRPGLSPAGGGPQELYYVPEAWVSLPPAETPLVVADQISTLLEAVSAPSAAPVVDPDAVPLATRAEIDAHWDQRPLDDGDHVVRLEPLDTDRRLAPGRPDTLAIRVTNAGGAIWPGGLERAPLIRIAHRWCDASGAPLDPEWTRAGLPGPLTPGESTVLPLVVSAPTEPGDYVVEIDAVHELVRWFACSILVPVLVAERPRRRSLPPR